MCMQLSLLACRDLLGRQRAAVLMCAIQKADPLTSIPAFSGAQVQDAPLPRLGDTLNARVPWYGDAQPASQVHSCREMRSLNTSAPAVHSIAHHMATYKAQARSVPLPTACYRLFV